MKQRVRDFARAVVTSPELLAALIAALVGHLVRADLVHLFGSLAAANIGEALVILGVPISLVVAAYKMGGGILHPPKGREILLAWPDYWRLKMRVGMTVWYCILGLLAYWVGLYLAWKGFVFVGGMTVIVGGTVAVTALITAAHATFTVRELLDAEASDENPSSD